MRKMVTMLVSFFALAATAFGQAESPSARAKELRITPIVRTYQQAAPAVVNISTERLARVGLRMFGMEDSPFEDVIPDPFARTVPMVSLGSGFLIHPEGYIVTNAHVVGRAQKITVTLADKSSFVAEVVAANSEHDMAVLRLLDAKGRQFKHLALGRSDDLMIGETVIAIGNPLGLQNTLTTGVISATDRKLNFPGGVEYGGLIQMDAPINPGNSGGPLLNVLGELVGINTAIRADAQGIGFAIPVDLLAADFPRLLDYERLNRVIVGLVVEQRRGQAGEELAVKAVAENSPAASAGARQGDVVLAVDGKAVANLAAYQIAMLAVKGGQKVALEVQREGKVQQLCLTVKEKPKPDGAALVGRLFGLELDPITPELAKRQKLPVEEGMVVRAVTRGGPADKVGIRAGDVLYQLGRFYIANFERLGAVLEDVQPGQQLPIGIIRGNVRAWGNIQAQPIDMSPPELPSQPGRTKV